MTCLNLASNISLGFVGDICLSLEVINTVRRHGTKFIFEKVHRLFEDLNLVIGNLESCIIDDCPAEPPLRPPLYTPRDVAEALRSSGIGVFSLANNHVMDFGPSGLRSTLEYMNEGGFHHFGAGMTRREAEAPLYVEVGNRKLAFLGACDVTACWASDDRPGVAPLSERRLLNRVAQAKERADIVVAVLHADLEFVSFPAPWRQRLSRKLIKQGAAVVVQHHPHVCQGIERYMDGLIAYSLGNHVFQVHENEYQGGCAGTADSMLLQVDIGGPRTKPTLSPTAHLLDIDMTNRPVPCDAATAQRRRRDIEQLNTQVIDPRLVRAVWRSTCWQQVYGAVFGGYYTMRRKGLSAAMAGQIEILRTAENRRWIYGFLSAGFR
jgi:hypothetical protein